PGLFLSPFDFSGGQVIDPKNDPNFLREFAEVGLASNLVGHKAGVFGDCEMQRISFLALNGFDGRLDVAHQSLHMTWSGIAGQGRLDGTATVVTDNNDEAGAEMVHCVFDAAQSVV